MGHPLTPDLTKLTIDELNAKYGDLLKRVTYAYRIGNPDMVQQLQMLMEDYRLELDTRNRKALEEMEKHSKNFKNIIDIQ
jgi:predicted transcriptional regulator of viral defense system